MTIIFCQNLIPSVSLANICQEIFTYQKLDSDQVFTELDKLEIEINEYMNYISSQFGRSESSNKALSETQTLIQPQILKLQELQERALQDFEVHLNDIHQIYKGISAAKKSLKEKLEFKSTAHDPSTTILDFQKIVENPSETVSEAIYHVTTNDGKPLKVLFSKSLVEDLFQTQDSFLKRSLSKSLNTIKKGVFGSQYVETGIIHLGGTKNRVEIRTMGQGATLRVFGYLHEGVYHFVYWHESNHTVNHVKKIINTLNKISASRGD